MRKSTFLLPGWLVLSLFSLISASDRIPDIALYENEVYLLHNVFPLDAFLADQKLYPRSSDAPMMVTRRGQMDGTDNPNFHIANWEIRDRQLYLVDIEAYVYPNFDAWYLESIEKSLEAARSMEERQSLTAEIQALQKQGVRRHVVKAMDYFFPERTPGQAVFAQWFSGQLLLEKQEPGPFASKSRKQMEMNFHHGVLQSVRQL